jgi:hypothetical protein
LVLEELLVFLIFVILVLFCLIRYGLLLNIILDFELFLQDIRDYMVGVVIIYNIIVIAWKIGIKLDSKYGY